MQLDYIENGAKQEEESGNHDIFLRRRVKFDECNKIYF
jgi:hypothetical protein